MKTNDRRDLEVRNNREHYDLFDPFFDDFFRFPPMHREFRELERVMKTDVKENDKNYELEVELPGFKKEDVSIDIDNGYLTITASKNSNVSEKDNNGNFVRKERHMGKCTRSFYVGNIDENLVEAKLENGVLNIIVPKENPTPKQKRIEIK